MQPPVEPVRAHLTQAQVVALIQDSAALIVGCGCELLDMDLNVVEDLSEFCTGSVSRSSYATLHGTATLAFSIELDWGTALVRPYMTLDDGAVKARFNLGAYFTNVPAYDVEETPRTYAVQGVDILHGLYPLVGESYSVDAGVSYLAAVESILIQQGYTRYVIDQQSAAVLPSPRAWPLDNQTRWLHVVNDLLGAVGYQGVWSDWDGRLRCQPYQTPRERAPEWTYPVSLTESMLGAKRTVESDYFEAPNRWVVFRQNNVDDQPLTEGNGIYTYVNQYTGPMSVEARGRVFSRVESVDAADQASLVAAAQPIIDSDMRLQVGIKVPVAPNPLHWHFDRLQVVDPALGSVVDVLCTQWTLPLDGQDMSQEWTVL